MWFLQKLRGKMEDQFEAKSQLHNHHHPDSQLHSDPSIDNDNLVQIIAKDLQNLVLSFKDDVVDQHIQVNSVVTHDENQVKQQVDDGLPHLVVQAESSTGSEETVERELPKDSWVLEERGISESEMGCGNQEIEVENEDVGSGIGDSEENNDEHVEDLETESKNVGGDDGKTKGFHYPLRLDAEDCAYYIRTGMCKFGSNCKYNHPLSRKNQQPSKEPKKQQQLQSKKQKEENVERNGQSECKPSNETKKQKEENVERHGKTEGKPTKETKKQKEENTERHGQTECKYHASSSGCKYGKACKFNHGKGKSVKTPVAEYNFVGLPIRPGEKECPYYMRNGSCKYGTTCRFNHPDPTIVGGDDAPTTYGNGGPLPLQPAPQPNISNIPSWSTPRTPDPTPPFVPIMYPPTQNMPPPNPDWNAYQAPAPVPPHLYPSSEQGLPIPPAFLLNNPPSNTNMYTHHQQPMLVSEYPERPGQPDCSFYMKTGVCKYRASCKFNHPRSRNTKSLRDQNICTYFSRHGTCKYGSACKYDHPVSYNSNSNPAGEGSNGPETLTQQSV